MRFPLTLLSLLFLSCATTALHSDPIDPAELRPDYNAHKVKALKATVDYLESLFLTNYGPIRWKQIQWGWNPGNEATFAKSRLDNLDNTRIDTVKPIFSRLLDSTRDAHVGVRFADKRACTMAIKISMIDGQVVVTSSRVSGVLAGDVITSVNGQPILDYATQILYGSNWSDMPLARPQFELRRVFFRSGKCCALPKADELVKIGLQRKGKDIQALAFWTYIPNVDWYMSGNDKDDITVEPTGQETSFSKMVNELASLRFEAAPHEKDLDQLEAIAMTLPEAESLAMATQEMALTPRFDQPHWLIKQVKGKRIAYFRLPDFSSDKNLEVFDESLLQMQRNSDALFIDLRDNPGGIDYQCLAFLSRLGNEPMLNLIESKIIDEAAVSNARDWSAQLQGVLDQTTDEKVLHSVMGSDSLAGYYITAQLLRDIMFDNRSVCEEWEAGFTCTRFTPHAGIRYIECHPTLRYTKPIFVLINENDASCADYFPAVLKDNARATLLGRTTCGAGGVLKTYKIPNFTGIESFSLTHSLLLRNNQLVIEDLGIAPHYEMPLTLEIAISNKIELEQALERAADLLMKAR